MTRRTLSDFRGFDDPVELFQAGVHTDSEGRTGEWTTDDLDEIVASHNDATAAPIVIGHPKTSDPAWGLTAKLFRAGKSLMGAFHKVEDKFSKMVEEGRFPKRSVSIGRGPDGKLRLLHVGFLGAAAPALDLAPMSYEAPKQVDQVFEFNAENDWQTPGIVSRALRRMREFLLDKFDADTADRVLPSHDLDFLDEHANDLRQREREGAAVADDSINSGAFSRAGTGGKKTVSEFTQADIDKAKAEAKADAEAEFNRQRQADQTALATERAERHRAEFSAELDKLQGEGKLTPAQASGALEFMVSLAAEPAEFEFAAADGKSNSKTNQLDWFREFVKALPKQVRIGKREDDDPATTRRSSFAAPNGTVVDADRLDIHQRALDYAAKNNTTYLAAVKVVEQQTEA